MCTKEKEILPAYISNNNSSREKQIILWMIPNEEREGWYYFAVKKFSTLLRGIISKYHGDFYCLNCVHSFKTKNKLKSQEKVWKNKDFCGTAMPSEKDKMLKFNKYIKSYKMPYIIYVNLEFLMKTKVDGK